MPPASASDDAAAAPVGASDAGRLVKTEPASLVETGPRDGAAALPAVHSSSSSSSSRTSNSSSNTRVAAGAEAPPAPSSPARKKQQQKQKQKQEPHSLPVAVDLGASWIHGTEGNPIARLCAQLGFRTHDLGERVGMLDCDGSAVDPALDERIHAEFDAICAAAQDEAWAEAEAAAGAGAGGAVGRVGAEVSLGTRVAAAVAARAPPFTAAERRLLDWHCAHAEYVRSLAAY